jgi:hypothetical protein
MAEFNAPQQDWLSPNHTSAASTSFAPPPPPPARFDLRPLTTGEILDRTFTLLRSRFWLFVGLSAISAAIAVPITTAQRALMHQPTISATPSLGTFGLAQSGPYWAVVLIGGLLSYLVHSITNAATVSAVSAVYLGHQTSIAIALRSIWKKWFRYPLIGLWQAWSAIWVFFILMVPAIALIVKGGGLAALGGLLMFLAFLSLIYGAVAFLRNSLAVPASVIENVPVRQAMRRSKYLSNGGKGRIFLLGLLLWVLYLVLGMIQMPFALLIAQSRATQHALAYAVVALVNFLAGSLVAPVGAIGLCLFYFDERVRKEAFDIEFLMDSAGPPIPAAPAPAPDTASSTAEPA